MLLLAWRRAGDSQPMKTRRRSRCAGTLAARLLPKPGAEVSASGHKRDLASHLVQR